MTDSEQREAARQFTNKWRNGGDEEYRRWILQLKDRYKNSQIKAAVSVNQEMLLFYWSLGRDIVAMDAENRYGRNFYNNLSADLRRAIPNAKGFSNRNLHYMKAFYLLYSSDDSKLPQAATDSGEKENLPQVVAKSGSAVRVKEPDANKIIFQVPWGHHRLIIDKCGTDKKKALFFIYKTVENGWSRAVLMNFLDTNLYERQGKAINNFSKTLPAPQSDLARELTKDPYNFDFISITESYNEKELKDALMDNITSFLFELGKGFALMGREFRIVVGDTEQFFDMLFYNTQLHCYVVVEIKTRDFKPEDMGQLGTYIAIADGVLKSDADNQTVGLLICKSKDNVLAQYAVNSSNMPIGISEYELTNLLPDDFKGTLPSIEEIEEELKNQGQ